MNSIDVINSFSASRGILSLTFNSFEGYEVIQNRIPANKVLDETLNLALEIRQRYHLPFWDSFNVSLFDCSLEDFSFLKEIQFHNLPRKIIAVNIKEIKEYTKNILLEKEYTTFNSIVNTESKVESHIPLLDFHIPISETNQRICKEIIRNLGLKGYLLNSGKSYHFIGKELVSHDELVQYLANALLYAPIIDRAWIAHQLIQKSCNIRVSEKYGRLPYVVDEIS